MSMETSCLFCKIASGTIPTEFIAESENAVAFRDIDPKAPTHVLVIPRSHYADLDDLAASNPNLAGELLALASEVANLEGLGSGYRIVNNNGEDAGQSVAHVHFHVLGGRGLSWPPG